MLARDAALDELSQAANTIISYRFLLAAIRDEDDARWFIAQSEIVAEQAEQFARNNYNVVINNREAT